MLRGQRIALFGLADDELSTYTTACAQLGAFSRRIDDRIAARALELLEMFDLVVLRIGGISLPVPIERAVIESCHRPVLVVGDERSIAPLHSAFASPLRGYMLSPWSHGELGLRLATLRHYSPELEASLRPVPTVVVADDDRVTSTLLESTLVRDGFLCRVARDGDEALVLMRQLGPEAAILDVNMPRRDGFSVLEAMKADAALSSIRVLMLTGSAGEQHVRRASELGADGFIVKPFKPAEVIRRVRRLI